MSGTSGRESSGKKRLLEFWEGVLKRRRCTRSRRAKRGTRAFFEALEPRVFLSGSMEGALVDTNFTSDLGQAPVTAETASLEDVNQTELLDLSGSADPLPQWQADLLDGVVLCELVFLDENL